MASNGNMKPESSIEGRKKKNDICVAWNCVRATDGHHEAHREHGGEEGQRAERRGRGASRGSGTSKSSQPSASTSATCTCPTSEVGKDLPDHHLAAPHRRRDQELEGAALALAHDGERRHQHHRHGEDHADEARHDEDRPCAAPGCRRAAPRSRIGSGTHQLAASGRSAGGRAAPGAGAAVASPRAEGLRCARRASRPKPSPASATARGHRRVAGVGEDRDLRAAPAIEAPVEVGRDHDHRARPRSARAAGSPRARRVTPRARRKVCVASSSPTSRRESALCARSSTAVGTWRTSRLIA